MPVANGVNIIKVTVCKGTGDEQQVIYNRGFFVYVDTKKPSVTLDNDNIVYKEYYDD